MHQDTILEPTFKKLPDLIAEVVITGAAPGKPAPQLMNVDEDSDASISSSPIPGVENKPIALSSDEEEGMTRHPKGSKDKVLTSKSTAKMSSKSTKTAAPAKTIRKSAAKKRKSGVLADASADSVNEDEGDDEDEDESEENSKPPKKKLKAATSKPVKDTKKLHQLDPWHLKSHSVRKDWREMLCPPLELFHFNRIVVDEYTYVDGKIYPLITNLVSNHRWILSGTPPTQDFASVKTIAAFMGLHLGIDDDFWEGQSKEALREAKKRQKDQTSKFI
jgi:Securin sister-chromatid separation inhibitor